LRLWHGRGVRSVRGGAAAARSVAHPDRAALGGRPGDAQGNRGEALTIAVFLGSLLGAMALGIPIAYALLVSAMALMWHLELFDAQILAQNLIEGANSFTLLAVPFFLLAGEIMNVGVAANVSITRLFLAGIVPGLLIGASLWVTWWWLSRREQLPVPPRKSFAEMVKALRESAWALVLPLIILVGLRFGVFTPTEAAVVAAVYALFVAAMVYREITLAQI